VLFASLIGTAIEFFDFYIYATARGRERSAGKRAWQARNHETAAAADDRRAATSSGSRPGEGRRARGRRF
jgi:hypothetical protein